MERLKELVAANAPVLHMHHRDAFMPCSAEFFMANSELWHDEAREQKGKLLLARGKVNSATLSRFQEQYGGHPLQLRLHPSAKCGPPQEKINDTPLYANVKRVVNKDGTLAAIEINYLTFYAHNGHYDVGYIGLFKVGAHDGDWEHITVRLSPETGALQAVYCNAHRSFDGCWVSADKVERTCEGRIKAYVARHGHGTYPQAGIWWRAGCCANDLTSDKGPVWKASTVVLLPRPLCQDPPGMDLIVAQNRGVSVPPPRNRPLKFDGRGVTVTEDEAEWVKYTGQWGTTPSPSNQGWFYTAEPPVSRGVFLRILGHLCPETKTLL